MIRKMVINIISNRHVSFLSLSRRKNDIQLRAYLRDSAIPQIGLAASCISRKMMQNYHLYTFTHLFN